MNAAPEKISPLLLTGWESPVISGKLIKRYKRFLADVILADGSEITVHCPNSGSMLGLNQPNLPVLLTHSPNPKRKYPHTLECIQIDAQWVCVNTMRANHLAGICLKNRFIPHWNNREVIKREPVFGKHTRFDFLLSEKREGKKKMLLEVKSVTLSVKKGIASFPDAVTERGRKHIRELIHAQDNGFDAGLLFMCMRSDCNIFQAASQIDPQFAKSLKLALDSGVQIKSHGIQIDKTGFYLKPKPLVTCI